MTGNEGKPFSPTEALRLIVAESTVFTKTDRIRLEKLTFSYNLTLFNELLIKTPDIILKRKRPNMTTNRVNQRRERVKELEHSALTLTAEEIEQMFKLAISDTYLRYPFLFIRMLYYNHYPDVTQKLKQKNALSIYQNLYEILVVLSSRDKVDGTQLAFDVIRRFLRVHFIFTGGIDQWETKRLSGFICDIIIEYNNSDITREFLELLNVSSIRIAVDTEFNLYPMFNPKPEITGLTGIPKPLYLNHFYEYVVQLLGPNYTWHFDDTFNRKKAIEAQENVGPYGIELAQDQIMHSLGIDFDFFSVALERLAKTLQIDTETINLLDDILLSYKRCLAVNVQRIMIKHRDLFAIKEDNYEFLSPNHIRFVNAKHEHHLIRRLFDNALIEMGKLYEQHGFEKEGRELWDRFKYVLKEASELPLPKPVPGGLLGSATPDDFEDEEPPPPGIVRHYKIRRD